MIAAQLGSAQLGAAQLGNYDVYFPEGSGPTPTPSVEIVDVNSLSYIALPNFFQMLGRWPWP